MSGFGWAPPNPACGCHMGNSIQGRCCHGNLSPAMTPTYTPPSTAFNIGRPSYPSAPAPAARPIPPPTYTPPSYAPLRHISSSHTSGSRTNVSQGPGYYWVDTTAGAPFPSSAIRGGSDVDGQPIYVGRAFHAGDWIPAKVIPGRRVAYVSYDGKEHEKHNFQVLCEQRFDWVRAHGGHVPPGAVEGGRTSSGEILYVGRAHHQGSHTVGKVPYQQRFHWVPDHDGHVPPGAIEGGRTSSGEILYVGRAHHQESDTVGKVHPSHHCCYIPFGGKEVYYKDYEVLVLRS